MEEKGRLVNVTIENEMPKGWTSLSVKKSVSKIPLTGKKIKQKEYLPEGILPVIDQGQEYIGGYTDNEDLRISVPKPVIVFGDHTKCFKYVNFDFAGGADGIKVLKPIDAFLPKLFYYFLNAIQIPNKGYARHYQFLEKSDIPLPPLPEQERIVGKVEELFSDLDAGVAALEVVKKEIKRYRQAMLKNAFEGKLTEKWRKENKDKIEPASKLLERITKEREKQTKGKKQKKLPPLDALSLSKLPDNWEWSRVAEIGTSGEQTVLTGPFGSSLGRSDFISKGIPLLTIGCLTEQGIKLKKAFYISNKKADELSRYKVTEGDLLFSRSASVGRVGYVTPELEGSLINYHLMRLRLDADTISPHLFIYYVRGSKTVKDYLRYVNHGATRDGINTANLLGMPVAIPPLSEQKEIVSEVERLFSIADQSERIVEQALKQSQRLRQSILKRAFEGKLVPQDPNEESAEKLLERIKKEKG